MSTLPDLGRRGEGWVALQVLLFALVGLATLLDRRAGAWAIVLGAALAAAGALLLAIAVRSLGRSTTAFPRPNEQGLVARGVYRRARHPMYGAGLLVALGWSVAAAPWGLVPTAALWLVFEGKSRVEERWLLAAYPRYADYRRTVRHRFFPL